MEVHRPAPDPIAARVADDHAPEPRQQRAQEDEAGPHLRCRFERHEEPVHVAGRDLVDVGRRMVHDHAEVA